MKRCRSAVVLLLFGVAGLAGCTHVITQTTPYYEDGPYQLDPPQGELPAGTKACVIGKEGSYSRVWTVNGIVAYVWDGAIMTVWEWDRQQRAQEQARREADVIVLEPEP